MNSKSLKKYVTKMLTVNTKKIFFWLTIGGRLLTTVNLNMCD